VGAPVQKLHLVGMTTTHDGLILSARKGARSGSFVFPITDELLETLAQAERLREEAEAVEAGELPPPTLARRSSPAASRLSPREMQARLRAGHSVAQVARAAGVDEEWVDRFAVPVWAEQERVIATALSLHSIKPRVGVSGLPLEEAIRLNLHERGVLLPAAPEGYRAQHLDGGRWVVQLDYLSRRRSQSAEWEVDLEARTVHPRNRLAAVIGYVASGRRRAPVPVAQATAAPTPARRGAGRKAVPAKKAPAKKTPAQRSSARKTAVRKAPANKAPANKAPANKAPAKKTPAKKTPAAKRSPARKAVVRKAPARKAPARKAPARKRPATRRAPRR
jgi:hypothetical protein